MPDRRFRDMSLTHTEAAQRAFNHIFDTYDDIPPFRATRANRIVDRAKRLLPLWRTWGLEELQAFKPLRSGDSLHKAYIKDCAESYSCKQHIKANCIVFEACVASCVEDYEREDERRRKLDEQ